MGAEELLPEKVFFVGFSQAALKQRLIITNYLLFTRSFASEDTLGQGSKLKSGASWMVYLAISLSSSSSKGRTLLRRRY
jgi:hypothetical protein